MSNELHKSTQLLFNNQFTSKSNSHSICLFSIIQLIKLTTVTAPRRKIYSSNSFYQHYDTRWAYFLYLFYHCTHLIPNMQVPISRSIWKHCNFPFMDKSTLVPFILAEGVEIHILTSNGEQSMIRISWGGGGFWILWP